MPTGTFNLLALYAIRKTALAWDVMLVRQGTAHKKRFVFLPYGGEAAALTQAQAWRDGVIKAHPPTARAKRAGHLRHNNTSGMSGVTRQAKSAGRRAIWSAKTYLGPGRILTKAFSEARWGEAARPMAIAERARQLMQMAGLALIHPDELLLRETPAATHVLPLPADAATWLRTNNMSGIAGVQRRVNATTLAATWLAQTRISGTLTLRRSFSVRRYGEAESKALAVAERAIHLLLKNGAVAALVKGP